ncbi:hypothetical protein AMES_8390 [Amycolatopsis mediterranei S699]|uniref:Uncharacterized protein n=2 Tax=Amycolatopsis mediterranei TaxID=33910 RepID=A0A0H3DH50_AMYMU|nr:hypothetical protein [Amycolatopsis mediterranei]ADJ50215.1 hypothetical protein AMED_8519 [Amycolatopsis mediterranei U32]AEK47212.1 hypothetical protein RAM_43725 [Amycolatopsis mediterranei S699]AFO81923.1 hypothetical protein AMES_8390 [Amycolatopsis mediterranei S699]AGT89052.1 hypothetical protein B737_8391 [Amycolatopsis mediterranei RB]KDO07536.1 hypothetical protein DV26_24925 [Amycolatopsis mediterranei]
MAGRSRRGRAGRLVGTANDVVDEAAAAAFGVNRTDLRIIGLVAAAGTVTAGQLATEAKLSPIERAGRALLAEYAPEQLELVIEVLRKGERMQLAAAERIRAR